ncbi:6-pyruvoyl trahydropterin synthase family protein [Mobilicoccus massiliensis]|uniref:6-pyruvoyl trahydropterin synthase family protein n=1 Tax=Mobilicoccus massiliensis TaxID=1522310 RepID=UPI00059128B8|nr:6-carboxytetrahydropterin synthase [Mobilicoccus massiliensis]
MFRLTVRDHVMIAHSLPDPFFGPAQGLHGATFEVEATWSRRDLDEHGVVLDIGAATEALKEVLGDLDYRNLDDHPAFAGRISTTEVVARHIADELAARLPDPALESLEVLLRENPDAWASYTRELGPTRA